MSILLLGVALLVLTNSSVSSSGFTLNEIIISEATPTKLENIEAELIPSVEGIPADMMIILSDINTEETIVIGETQNFVTASLYKLFVAYYAYGQIDEGKIGFDTVLSNHQTLDRCLDLMITVSDNECGVLLGELFGWANIDAKIHVNGFTGTTLNSRNSPDGDIMTTSTDIHSFFTKLYKGELMSEEYTKHLTDLLLNQKINDRLPPVLPENIAVAHKTGDVYNYIHDAGIIFSDEGDYVFVMMSAEWAEDMTFGPGYAYFQEIFSLIFNNI